MKKRTEYYKNSTSGDLIEISRRDLNNHCGVLKVPPIVKINSILYHSDCNQERGIFIENIEEFINQKLVGCVEFKKKYHSELKKKLRDEGVTRYYMNGETLIKYFYKVATNNEKFDESLTLNNWTYHKSGYDKPEEFDRLKIKLLLGAVEVEPVKE